MMNINEDALLQNVEVINGNLILDNKNPLFNSSITVFPPSLKTVTGKVSCTQEQYQRFGEDIRRVTGNNPAKIIVHSR